MPTESMADDAAPPTVAAAPPKKPPELHRGLRRRAHRARPAPTGASSASRPGMPTGTGHVEVPGRVPGPGLRRRDRRAARRDASRPGLALGGMRPVVALYSTFLQRAFDQTVHDVCQNDAAGRSSPSTGPGWSARTGRATRACSRCPAQRQLPNLVIAAPRDEQELRSLLRTALAQDHPFALHYPRDAGLRARRRSSRRSCRSAGARSLREGRDLLFVGFGPIVAARARGAPTRSRPRAGRVGVINARFAKPLDRQLILDAGPRQAARRDVRGERRDRRLRQRRARARSRRPA